MLFATKTPGFDFCRIHKSLRITPDMAAGITDHIWGIEDILSFSN
jgi:hypothetical protein